MARVLILTPEKLGAGGVNGSVVVTAECGHRAWLSPDGLALVLGGGATTRCTDCIDPTDVHQVEELPGVRQSLASLLGPTQADALLHAVDKDPSQLVRVLQRESARASRRRRR